MKKLIITLSALTITTTVVPTIVACGKEEKRELDLSSLTADSFKELDVYEKNGIGIVTKKLNEINDDTEFEKAIKEHIKIMTLKKVFGLKGSISIAEKDRKINEIFIIFWELNSPSILDIKVNPIETNKKYEITIKKEKWENIKIDPDSYSQETPDNIKHYYDLIKGDEVKITITK